MWLWLELAAKLLLECLLYAMRILHRRVPQAALLLVRYDTLLQLLRNRLPQSVRLQNFTLRSGGRRVYEIAQGFLCTR